jgi:hypothetical protein
MATAPKKCGKCDKTVYATEEIKCLDKVSSLIHEVLLSAKYFLIILGVA